MTLTFLDVFLVVVGSLSCGFGLGMGAAMVFLFALSFMRYAAEYLERIKKQKDALKQDEHTE